jgi:tetratricopeptide (TPR) repeat protein
MEGLFGEDETRAADIAHHYERAEVEDKAREYLYKAGQYALDNYKSAKALEFYDRLLAHEIAPEEKLKIFRNRGRILELTGRWDAAIETLEQGIGIAFASRNVYERARLMTQMGSLYQKKGKYDDAIDFLDRAAQTSGDLGDTENEGNALLDLGRAYWSKGAYDDSVKYYKESLKVKEKAGDRLGIALAHYYKGVTDRDMGEYDEAMACYAESLKLLEELDEKRYLTYPVYDMGVLYQYRGDLDQALEYFLRSRDAYEEIGYRSGTSAALLNLGVIEVRQGKFREALEFYEASLRIAEETGEQLAIAYTRFSIGAAHYMEGTYDETISHFEAAFQIMKAIGAKGYYGYVYAYLTCVYARQKQPTKALKTALLHYKIIKELGSDVENGRTAMGVALALAVAKDGRALGENARQYLTALAKVAGCEPTPAGFFEVALERARETDYINTLVPALREYGQYLHEKHHASGDASANERALELMREARERAAGSGMLRQLSRIQAFTSAHGVALDD